MSQAENMIRRDELDVGSTTSGLSVQAASRSGVEASRTAQRQPARQDAPLSTLARRPIPPSRLRGWLVLSDAVALAIAMALAIAAQHWLRPVPNDVVLQQVNMAAIAIPVWLLFM